MRGETDRADRRTGEEDEQVQVIRLKPDGRLYGEREGIQAKGEAGETRRTDQDGAVREDDRK